METHLHQELEDLEVSIMKMFALTERSLDKAIQSLVNRNDDLAEEVIQADYAINQLEVEVEDQALNILALWQPVARDLRLITACSRISNDLERIGDQATNIAERAIMLNKKPRLTFMNAIKELADISLRMYRDAITSFSNKDCTMATQICRMDNTADEKNVQIIKQLIDYMANESVIVERAVHSIIVSNALERIGDLATNIAEEIVFISRGINIKHTRQFDDHCQE